MTERVVIRIQGVRYESVPEEVGMSCSSCDLYQPPQPCNPGVPGSDYSDWCNINKSVFRILE